MNLIATAASDPIGLHSSQPLAVPVFSGAGGVGRSTVSALIAALLERYTADSEGAGVVLCDTAVRGQSPWPTWVDVPAVLGTIHVLGAPHPRRRSAADTLAASIFEPVAGRSFLVMTDTGDGAARGTAVAATPRWWSPVLRGARAVVIDGDGYEGVRLRRSATRFDQPSLLHQWLGAPRLRTAPVWVTDPSPLGYARTHDALLAAETGGLDPRRLTVVVNHARGNGSSDLARARRAQFCHRVGGIVDLRPDPALEAGAGCPRFTPRRLERPDAQKLLTAILRGGGIRR